MNKSYWISKSLWLITELKKCSIKLNRIVIDENYLNEIENKLLREQRKKHDD